MRIFFLNRPLLPYGVEGFLLVNLRELVGLLGRVIGPTQGLYLHTGQHNTEKRRHTSMPRAGFKSAISTSERPKTVLASDRSAIETGLNENSVQYFSTHVSHMRSLTVQVTDVLSHCTSILSPLPDEYRISG
jgi:hypothetical protein